MSLSPESRAELERPGVKNVRHKLARGSPDGSSVVPGLGSELTRTDVEAWLSEKDDAAQQLQLDILWWAKAAALVSAAGIVVAVAIAALGYVWSAK